MRLADAISETRSAPSHIPVTAAVPATKAAMVCGTVSAPLKAAAADRTADAGTAVFIISETPCFLCTPDEAAGSSSSASQSFSVTEKLRILPVPALPLFLTNSVSYPSSALTSVHPAKLLFF